jgi:uncharacterized membrane protein
MHFFSRFHHHRLSYSLAAAVIAVSAFIGMVDSFYLVLQYIEVLLHPGEATPCTINTLVSCTKTVQGSYAHYFPGIPNPLLGMLWYSGLVAYGITRYLGSEFSRQARAFVGVIIVFGLLLSYRLYFASVFELRGVCPFCLLSTALSTIIALAFVLDDRMYDDAVVGSALRRCMYVFQALSVAVFVVYLPYFIISGLLLIPDPMAAMTHWSMSFIALLILLMATTHVIAYRKLSHH